MSPVLIKFLLKNVVGGKKITSIFLPSENFSKFFQGSELEYPFTSSGKLEEPFNVVTSTLLKIYLELTIEDRLVFIITTFFIRYISLILIQWSVDINIIKSFEEGFFFYAVIYISIFWFIVLFVNIDNAVKIDYMNFDNFMNSIRSIFYYFYMGTNGITRLLVHSCIICVLLIVPIILNIKKKSDIEESENKDNIISYDERKKLSKSLSLFTIFIWILTSIIATKF